jgi:hypothetical protein
MSGKRSRANRQEALGAGAGQTPAAQEDDEAARAPGGSRRFPAPAELKGATAFAADANVRNSDWLFGTIRQTPLLGEEFLASMRVDRHRGPKRGEADWVLLYLDFVTSDSVDVQPWYAQADDALFAAAGCSARPCFRTVFDRFIELEELADTLEAAAAKLIQHARRFEPRIGMYLHVDSTEAETHAALVHDCPEDDPDCKVWKARRKRARRRTERMAAWGGAPASDDEDDATETEDDRPEEEIAFSEKRPKRVPTQSVRELRQKAAAEAPPELTDPDEYDPDLQDFHAEGVAASQTDGKYRRIKTSSGCWYKLADTTAGIRAYTNGRGTDTFWVGFYNSKAIDHAAHAPVAIEVASASEQEFDIYPRLMARVERNLGVQPRAVVADRGYSVTKVFRFNSERGIASVIQWRKARPHERRIDHERYDRHGIPRCGHCGGPTEYVRFHHEPTPRIWYACLSKPTDACHGDQSIACSVDWRALVPLRRDDPVYLELRRSHKTYEAIHDYWRDRYKVAAADIGQRPKRTGVKWQQLRANGALLVEWLRICHLNGWLDNGRHRPCAVNTRMGRGTPAAETMRHFRTQIGLNHHYGPAAVRTFGDRHLRRTPSEAWTLRMRWEKRHKERTPKRRGGSAADSSG